MLNRIKILKAAEPDADTILRLQYEAYRSEAILYNDFSIPPLKQTLTQLIDEFRGGVVLKAVLDNEIVGSVRAYEKEGTIYIGKLIVLPRCQNQGVGKRLLRAIEDKFPGRRYELFTGDKSGKNMRLYEKCGYARFKTAEAAPGLVFVYLEKLAVDLREWTLLDAPALAEAINNKKILDNLRDGLPFPYTEKDAEEFISSVLSCDKNSNFVFAILYTDRVIGSIGVYRKDNIHRIAAELGYYIAEPYWGKGIMTRAVRRICDYVFENTDIIRIFAEPFAHNAASCRVLEKAGFRFEGVLRKNAVKNGQVIDMKMYAILRND